MPSLYEKNIIAARGDDEERLESGLLNEGDRTQSWTIEALVRLWLSGTLLLP